jgi:hypothetical protein
MKLIVINGSKNSKKGLLAHRLSNNSDCIWIKPYCDKSVEVNSDPVDDKFIYLNEKQLESKIDNEVILAETVVNGNRYVFFENQLNADYIVLIGDDRIVSYLKSNYGGQLVTVRCHSESEEYSQRSILPDKEFDIVYNYDSDDFDNFVFEIEDINDYQVN